MTAWISPAEGRLSPELCQMMEERQVYRAGAGKPLPLCQGETPLAVTSAAPILAGGDLLGAVVCLGESKTSSDSESKLCQAMAAFLGRHMEH